MKSRESTQSGIPRRRWEALIVTLLAVVSFGLGTSPAAADRTETPPGAAHATGWYLALGDSLAAGYQPGAPLDLQGGYVGDVLDAIRDDAPKTKLRNLACPGEDSAEMINGGGGCSYEEGSQLADALVFLGAHTATTRLITLTMGANDVTPCMNPAHAPAVIQQCVTATLVTFSANLASILGQLHQAAPSAQIIVTNYYDPYLASWLLGPAGQQLAVFSTLLQGQVNAVIAQVAGAHSAATADVAGAFETGNWTQTSFSLNGVPRTAPTNVATICQLTWMCLVGDIHPNDAGYDVLAGAVVAKLT